MAVRLLVQGFMEGWERGNQSAILCLDSSAYFES